MTLPLNNAIAEASKIAPSRNSRLLSQKGKTMIFVLLACQNQISADVVYEGQFYVDATTTAHTLAIKDGVVVAIDDDALGALPKGQAPQQLDGVIFPGS